MSFLIPNHSCASSHVSDAGKDCLIVRTRRWKRDGRRTSSSQTNFDQPKISRRVRAQSFVSGLARVRSQSSISISESVSGRERPGEKGLPEIERAKLGADRRRPVFAEPTVTIRPPEADRRLCPRSPGLGLEQRGELWAV